jgi:hypothetical protein
VKHYGVFPTPAVGSFALCCNFGVGGVGGGVVDGVVVGGAINAGIDEF